jgi:predicted ATPase
LDQASPQFEHVLIDPACVDLVGDLMNGAPGLTLLVTSREPLNVQQERVFDVHGLPLPTSAEANALNDSSAAQLFVQRAQQVGADVTATVDEREAVWQICRLVEGLPLGLELAAAWVRVLSCQEIAQEIHVDVLATSALTGTPVSEFHCNDSASARYWHPRNRTLGL